jgi:hypothetical protein
MAMQGPDLFDLAFNPADHQDYGAPEGEGAAMFGQSLLCRLNMHHIWHLEHTEDGQRFRRCLHCGKVDSRGGPGSGDWAAPIGGGG